MKKMMIAATVAALAGGVFADAQVYDMTLTVKTTVSKENQKASGLMVTTVNKAGYGYAKNEQVTLRKQGSMKIQGLFWGCDCDTIALPMWRRYASRSIGGYVFWNANSGSPYLAWPFTVFQWGLFNRIDKFQKVEGTWQLVQWQGNFVEPNFMAFVGAGFGSVKEAKSAGEVGWKPSWSITPTIPWGASPAGWLCNGAYVSSMNGGFAGFRLGGSDCVFCNGGEDVVPFCSCVTPDMSVNLTAAYGNWKLKYNASASKNLKKGYYITQSVKNKAIYNFGKYTEVRDYLRAIGNALVVPRGAYVDDDDYDDDDVEATWEPIEVADMVAASAKAVKAVDDDGNPLDDPMEFLPFDLDDEDAGYSALPDAVKDMIAPLLGALDLS